MSLIIKGMEMPNGCNKCDLLEFMDDSDDTNCLISTNDWSGCVPDYRPKNCPLIKIPTPHGRLIDADKLQTAIHGCLCENCQTFPCEKGIGCLIEDVFNLLDEAPTIIEAEVSE